MPLGVGHHPQHIPALVRDGSDAVQRPVRVRLIRDGSSRIAVSEDYLPVRFQACQILRCGVEASLVVGDRDAQQLPWAIGAGECRLPFDPQVDVAADEFQATVAQHGAGEKACLLQDLETVADSQDEAAP
jgi:hypothetical protein